MHILTENLHSSKLIMGAAIFVTNFIPMRIDWAHPITPPPFIFFAWF